SRATWRGPMLMRQSLDNPYLDDARLMDPTTLAIPFDNNYFDGVFCNSVIEHVTDIDSFMQEVHRVLKPGGWFWAKTPNRRHYVARIAGITPEWFHKFYNRLRGTQSRDIFPTTYICNDEKAISEAIQRHGFRLVSLSILEGRPEYLRIFGPMYFVGFLYVRLVNRFEAFKKFRCVILFHVVKPPDGSTTRE
ncbi:MAG: methyltransferase domain-containing protein, partial [Planctomycetota bacterium]|nr:methyltransferase domain-containing protein [Planctomycetota bacterium]